MRAKTLDEFISRFSDDRGSPWPIPGSDAPEKGVIYRGRVGFGGDWLTVERSLPNGFRDVPDWQDKWYRLVWTDPERRAIVTYCEGDVSITIDRTPELYLRRMAQAAAFYQEH